MFDEKVALHRVEQQIAWRGKLYSVYRPELNEFNEKIETDVPTVTIKALFHNGSSNHIVINTADNSQVPEKNTPYLITTWVNGVKLRKDDIININKKSYKVTGIYDINEYNIITEVSLEVILDAN